MWLECCQFKLAARLRRVNVGAMKALGKLLWVGAHLILGVSASAAVLIHRYPFSTDCDDAVGTAHGVIQGNAVLSDGALVLSGTNASVLLPVNLLTNFGSASLEVWFADDPVNGTNAQIFSFNGAQSQLSYALGGETVFKAGTTSSIVNLKFPPVGGTNHLIWAQDEPSQAVRIYVNGQLAIERTNVLATPAMMGATLTNRIGGGATTNRITNFRGRILDFRIYEGSVTEFEAAALHAFGPDQVLGSTGPLQDVRLEVPAVVGPGARFPAKIYADFLSVSNIDVSAQPQLILTSTSTNVVSVEAGPRLRTRSPGTALVIAEYGGRSNSITMEVATLSGFALEHRYSFNELTNDWILHDSAGDAHGRVYSTSGGFQPPNAVFTGKGELKLSGGHAALPPGILSSKSEVTIEAWVTWTQKTSPTWQRIFDFGCADAAGWGFQYIYLSPDGYGSLTSAVSTNSVGSENPRLAWTTNVLLLNVTSHVAVVQSAAKGIYKIYVNGQNVASARTRVWLADITDTNNWLGLSQFTQDAKFQGRYNEFRIYHGALTDTEVLADYLAGPETIGSDFVLRASAFPQGLNVSCGAGAADWILETSPALGSGAIWQTLSATPIFTNGRYSVTVPFTTEPTFFRLRAPIP